MRAERYSLEGKRIKKRLIDLGMTQKELAAELGVSKSYLCQMISGRKSTRKYWEDIRRILKLTA